MEYFDDAIQMRHRPLSPLSLTATAPGGYLLEKTGNAGDGWGKSAKNRTTWRSVEQLLQLKREGSCPRSGEGRARNEKTTLGTLQRVTFLQPGDKKADGRHETNVNMIVIARKQRLLTDCQKRGIL